MAHQTPYRSIIAKMAPDYDPRHIEAYMRLGHSTLDGLSIRQFQAEVSLAAECVDYAGKDAAEACAKSFGL